MSAPDRDVDVRRVLFGAAIIAAIVITALGVVVLLLRHERMPLDVDRVRLPYALDVPGPRLQSAPQPELRAYRTEKARLLDRAGWVDRERGIARVPLDEAMALRTAPPLAASAAAAASGALP